VSVAVVVFVAAAAAIAVAVGEQGTVATFVDASTLVEWLKKRKRKRKRKRRSRNSNGSGWCGRRSRRSSSRTSVFESVDHMQHFLNFILIIKTKILKERERGINQRKGQKRKKERKERETKKETETETDLPCMSLIFHAKERFCSLFFFDL
jgi:hypothetical protein